MVDVRAMKVPKAEASTLFFIFTSVVLNASAQILIRVGALAGIGFGDTSWSVAAWNIFTRPAILAGLASYGLSVIIWIHVLSRAEVSYAYPFLGAGFVLVSLAGWLVLDEALSTQRILATALIAIGVFLLANAT